MLRTMDEIIKTLPLAEVEKQLASSPQGLTQSEAARRLDQYGANEIVAKKVNQFLKFLGYFWGPIPWMIVNAGPKQPRPLVENSHT